MRIINILLSTILLTVSCNEKSERDNYIRPEGFFDLKEAEADPRFKKLKEEYLNTLYYAKKGTDVDVIRKKQRLSNSSRSFEESINEFANGKIQGEWIERGPINESGDIQEVDFDPETNDLYVLSTVGHIFRGNLDNRPWVMLNDQYDLNINFFEHVSLGSGKGRLLGIYGSGLESKMVRYSDDYGTTWEFPKGITFYDHYGSPKAIYEMSDGTIFYFVHTWDANSWSSSYELYKSIDKGLNYSKVFEIDNADNAGSNVRICKYPSVDSLILYDLNNKERTIIGQTALGTQVYSSEPLTGADFTNYKFHATGRFNGDFVIHYVYSDSKIYTSPDGLNWTLEGTARMESGGTMTPWGKGKSFIVNPLNNELYSGGFQFNKTTFGNELMWYEQYVNWWKYYDKNLVNNKDSMHVDITGIEYFKKEDGTPFFIILNHAGIHCSYDNMKTTKNLGMQNLNCVTLYDHVTAPDGSVYFGAQDKGTFFIKTNVANADSSISTVNLTTGDGMRELIFNNGNSYFGCLQNGFIICKPDKNDLGGYYSWQLPGDHIPGWITPMENHPNPSSKKCYIAGGNINGGSGSYLIEMRVDFDDAGSNLKWYPNQFNYDFRANSNSGKGIIKALSACESDTNRLYVATSDGSFFSSSDAGETWNRSTEELPVGFLPWDIAVSKLNPDTVIVCGTGWSNTGVLLSADGGQTFYPLSNKAIYATYFDIALTKDDKFLYAATSEGPRLYDFEAQTWFDLNKNNIPVVEYRSVEFLEEDQIARFGTYGRGLWDLKITEPIITSVHKKKEELISIYPNPTNDFVKVKSNLPVTSIQIFNLSGQIVNSCNNCQKINLEKLGTGCYWMNVSIGDLIITKEVIKL